jgi:ketosteroid isomerase-like protein
MKGDDVSAEQIAATNRRLSAAIGAGDPAAAAACYTEAGQFLVPNLEPLVGRSAIEGFFQGALDTGVTALELETLELELHGDTACEIGRYTLRGEARKSVDRGKFVVLWKNVGGDWLLHRDIINTSMPAAS